LLYDTCTQNLGPDSVRAIIIHVTDTEDFKTDLNKLSYDAMDPAVTSDIFSTLPDSELTTDETMNFCQPPASFARASSRIGPPRADGNLGPLNELPRYNIVIETILARVNCGSELWAL